MCGSGLWGWRYCTQSQRVLERACSACPPAKRALGEGNPANASLTGLWSGSARDWRWESRGPRVPGRGGQRGAQSKAPWRLQPASRLRSLGDSWRPPLGSGLGPQNPEGGWVPEAGAGDRGGNITGGAGASLNQSHPPPPHLSQGGDWEGGALQLHDFSLWRGAVE